MRELTRYLIDASGELWNYHLIAILTRQTLSRILYYDKLYRKIVDVPGVICEFGVQYGATLGLLTGLRGIYEPYNHTRKVFGFDTFTGFPFIDEKDGLANSVGDYSSGETHFKQLEKILELQELFNPKSHHKKYELIRGDACTTFCQWLDDNPALIISMAIFDFDIYRPTKTVLENIVSRLTKGSLLVFDELSCPFFPGETIALMETLGINNLRLKRDPNQSWCSYAVWE